jgi:hypothetical protein
MMTSQIVNLLASQSDSFLASRHVGLTTGNPDLPGTAFFKKTIVVVWAQSSF